MDNFFPIIPHIFTSEEHVLHQKDSFVDSSNLILSDFDGTISFNDVTDTLLTCFGQQGWEELEEQWLAGHIGSQKCMCEQVALLDVSLDEMNTVLNTVEIDLSFIEFVHSAQKMGVQIQVVSDGLDYAIRTILSRYGLGYLPIYANCLWHDGKRGWRLTFPYANTQCVKSSGNCKCAHLKKQEQIFKRSIYIGDGTSDFCVSDKTSIVLAKDKLITYCNAHNIAHYPIKNFSDATKLLPDILTQQKSCGHG